ncbi:archease [Candidatus Pacearchaeota archaeon]|nr:archease [Candidatus Pacearchaeota archaeon]
MEEKFKFLEHTADKKFQAFGNTLIECFSNSAYAIKSIISAQDISPIIKKEIRIKGPDLCNLMMSFLEEFLVLIDTENFILSKIDFIEISSKGGQQRKSYELFAVILGDDIKNYSTNGDIKAVTYSEMFVKEINNVWTSQVIVDV